MIRAHQPGSEPIDIPETIPNPVVVPKPTPTPTEPAPKEPVRIPERVPGTHELPGRGTERAIRSRWSGHGATSPARKQLAEALAAAQERLVHLLSCDIEREPAGGKTKSLAWDMPTSSGTRTALMAGRKPTCRCGSRCRNRSHRSSAFRKSC